MPYSLLNASALGLDLLRRADGAQIAEVLLTGLVAGPRVVATVRQGLEPASLTDRALALRLVAGRPLVPAAEPHPAGGGPAGGDLAGGDLGAGDLAAGDLGAVPSRGRDTRPGHGEGGAGAGSDDPAGAAAAEHVRHRLLGLLARWQQVGFGTVDDLLALVRDLPADAWDGDEPRTRTPTAALAAAVLHDAVLARATRELATPAATALADRLDAPFSALRPLVPALARAVQPAAWPGAGCVPELLAALATLTGDGDGDGDGDGTSDGDGTGDGLRRLAELRPPPGRWAHHVHDACWAAELTGRVVPAAAAQLDLVRVLHHAGLAPGGSSSLPGPGPGPGLGLGPGLEARVAAGVAVRAGAGAAGTRHGVWSSTSGAVAVHVVADLASAESLTLLAGPVRDLLGLAALS